VLTPHVRRGDARHHEAIAGNSRTGASCARRHVVEEPERALADRSAVGDTFIVILTTLKLP
jgi:hypothetical protein